MAHSGYCHPLPFSLRSALQNDRLLEWNQSPPLAAVYSLAPRSSLSTFSRTSGREESVKHSQVIRSLFVIVLAMLAANAFAQSAGAVHGKVLGPDNKPMAGVAVSTSTSG